MVVTNHPLASAAGAEMLAAGGNAIDAAIAAFFTLTVVEPMMVGILGGGMAHLRLADGRHVVIDGQSTAPLATGPTTYTHDPEAAPGTMDTVGRKNALGPTAVGAPGNLAGWCEVLARFGTFPLADVMEPAIRHASRGFRITPYLQECATDAAADLARDPEIAALYLPGGTPIQAGARLVTGAYADTLRAIAQEGPALLYGGALGRRYADHMARSGGYLTMEDFTRYRTIERDAIRGTYRGFEVVGPPPPASGGVHVVQMLNLMEGFDVAGLGFGTPEGAHLLAEVLKIAFADRAAATGDPAFVDVPIARLIDKAYAAERRGEIDMTHARHWKAGVTAGESAHTTHLTVADAAGMYVFDPRPGRASSVAPGKRVTSSMAPTIVLKDGKPAFALGLPGGLRIFPSAFQAVVNLIDHGMSLQQAVEAPRLWTQGFALEMEDRFPASVQAAMRDRGHDVLPMKHVGGGMNAIRFWPDGEMEGAACWRADGTPIGIGGGLARRGVRFNPDPAQR
ncbi:MAG: gamma-glutamyltransferase family protein [Rhodospirillales bacterium]|nr:gamma-glutamyltransferase family protein [Rhodospirillales bacterium]